MGSIPTRGSSFFLGKVTALGVLCCFALLFVCLTVLASFFLPSHLSLKHVSVCVETLILCSVQDVYKLGCDGGVCVSVPVHHHDMETSVIMNSANHPKSASTTCTCQLHVHVHTFCIQLHVHVYLTLFF